MLFPGESVRVDEQKFVRFTNTTPEVANLRKEQQPFVNCRRRALDDQVQNTRGVKCGTCENKVVKVSQLGHDSGIA